MNRPSLPSRTGWCRPRCKIVLEPVFEADFHAVTPTGSGRARAADALAERHDRSVLGRAWVMDADIRECFDQWSGLV